MESMIHALYLLEQLKLTGIDFIFKGGTSLILILDQPHRFSVDIDIILRPDYTREELERRLASIIETSKFTRVELENHYPTVLERPIQSDWLICDDTTVNVLTPDINSIAGDKLTAFAPNTTGVPYYRESAKDSGETIRSEMFMEIIKQAFDIGCLFDLLDNPATFGKSFSKTAEMEIRYRPERNIGSVEEVLRDTIATAMIIARGNMQVDNEGKTKFPLLQRGINQFSHFVYSENFRIEQAQVAAAKAAYLAAMILSGKMAPIQRFDEQIPINDYLIANPGYNFLNKRLKFINKGEALFYWNKAINML